MDHNHSRVLNPVTNLVILATFIIVNFSLFAMDSADNLTTTLSKHKGWVSSIENKKWQHGSETCELNTDAKIDVLKIDQATYIFRQNKCTHYEAPFIYLLIGKEKALILDTGASEAPEASLFTIK